MKRHLPPLNALIAFEAAARLGRMTAAAQELSVTPGAVSKQVQNLELWLGHSLFEGSKNSPVLSVAGSALLPQLSAALDHIASAVSQASALASNTLSLTCYNSFAAKWLLPRLHHFAARYPAIDVQLSAATDIESQSLRHDVTVMAQAIDTNSPAGFERMVLWPEQLVPVISAELQRKANIRQAKQLSKVVLLHTRARPDAWTVWAAASGVALPKQTKRSPYQHYYFAIEAALSGQGACVAPWHLVADDIAAGRLVAPLSSAATEFEYVVLFKRPSSVAVQRFCQWIAEQAKSEKLLSD